MTTAAELDATWGTYITDLEHTDPDMAGFITRFINEPGLYPHEINTCRRCGRTWERQSKQAADYCAGCKEQRDAEVAAEYHQRRNR